MSSLRPEDDIWPAFADARSEARAGNEAGRLAGCWLGGSLALHLAVAAIILGFGQLYADLSRSAEPGPPAIMVSLTAAEGGAGPEGGSPESTDAAPEPSVSEANTGETANRHPLDSEIIPLKQRPDPPPVLKRVDQTPPELEVPLPVAEEKAPPTPSKASAKKTPKSLPPKDDPPKAKAGTSGRTQGGPAESAGSGLGSGSGSGQGQAGAGRGGGAGGGSAAGYVKGNYEYIKKRIRQHLVYSPQAKRMGIQGTVTVSFTIGQDGAAQGIAVSRSSGHGSLDESALGAVRNASPFPPPPAPARISVPINFSLK